MIHNIKNIYEIGCKNSFLKENFEFYFKTYLF